MRNPLILIMVAVCAAGLFFWLSSPEQTTATTTGGESNQPGLNTGKAVNTLAAPRRMAGAPPVQANENSEAPAETRHIAISQDPQREGESDVLYGLRQNWVRGFHSFEKRAQMTPEQRERFIAVLADTQEEAILAWETFNETLLDRNAPELTLRELDTAMEDELLVVMRTILNHKQMVSFRRTPGLHSALSLGRTRPLDISVRPADVK